MAGLLTRRQAALLMAAGAALAPQRVRAQDEAPEPFEGPEEAQVQLDRARFSHVTAPVRINGQGPFDFIIDTGANTSCLSHQLAKALALPSGPAVKVNTVAGAKDRATVQVDRLEIGGRMRRRVRAPVLAVEGLDADGVLGVDWLKGQRLVLDFAQSRMEITRSRQDRSQQGKVVVPARRRSGQLTIVDADLSGDKISAIIDSGSDASLANGALRAMVRKRDRSSTVGPQVAMISVAGETFYGESGYLPFMRLGGLHLGNVPVIYADTHVFRIWDLERSPAIIIGMDLLRQFETVHLDFGRSAVRFDYSKA